MTEAQILAESTVKLDDAAYRGPSEEFLQQLGLKLAPKAAEIPGPGADAPPPATMFAIGAPATIGAGFTGAIPALLAKRHGGVRLWEVNTEPNMHIVLTDLRTGEARIYSPFVADKRRMATPVRSRTGPEPDIVQRGSTHYGVEAFGIPPMFGNDWPSSAFSASVIFYDWLSNSVRIVNTGFQDAGDLPAVAPSAVLKPVKPAGAEGISGGATAAVEVSTKDAVRRKSVEGGEVIPASIIVIQLDEQYQQMIRLNIPVAAGEASAAGEIDLRTAWPGVPLRGECLLYLNVSGRISGPHKVTL
jgi:hypothetical protein